MISLSYQQKYDFSGVGFTKEEPVLQPYLKQTRNTDGSCIHTHKDQHFQRCSERLFCSETVVLTVNTQSPVSNMLLQHHIGLNG